MKESSLNQFYVTHDVYLQYNLHWNGKDAEKMKFLQHLNCNEKIISERVQVLKLPLWWALVVGSDFILGVQVYIWNAF